MLRILSLAGLTPDEFDLFVSYAHKDDGDGWISALLDAIRAEHHAFTSVPLRIFFDREAIRDMADWEHRILIGLRSAKVMLAVLSPAYVASPFCRREWQTYLDHELALALPGDGIAPLYTVTVLGFEQAAEAAVDQMLANLSRRQYLDVRPWRAEGIAAPAPPGTSRPGTVAVPPPRHLQTLRVVQQPVQISAEVPQPSQLR
jgi:F-box protein 11